MSPSTHFHPGSTSMIVGESVLDMSWFDSTGEISLFCLNSGWWKWKTTWGDFAAKKKGWFTCCYIFFFKKDLSLQNDRCNHTFACLNILAPTFRRMFWFSPFWKPLLRTLGGGSDRLHFVLEAYKMRLAPIGSSVASQKEMWDQEIITRTTRKPLDGYIYLHLPSTSTIHVGRYTSPVDPMGNPFGSFKYFWSNLTNIFQMGWSHQLDYIHSLKLTARQSPWKPC